MTIVWPALFAVAVVAGMWITERRSDDRALARKTYLLGIWGGILGARVWFSAQYGVWANGMSFWGFVVGATLAVAFYRRWHSGRWEVGDFPDAAAPALLLGAAVVRVGCFLNGCCYGKPSDLPWAVAYGPSSPAYHGQLRAGFIDAFASSSLPVHPTQLYEALFDSGLVLAIVVAPGRTRLPRHFLFLLAVAVYATFRFFLEFVRGDSGGLTFGVLTFAQASSLAIALGALALMWRGSAVVQKPVTGIEGEAQ